MIDFVRAYVTCALWSSTDESRDDGGDPLDDNYTVEDIAPDSLAKMTADCDAFIRAQSETMISAFGSGARHPSDAGHDFWLTRNGHGAGFWDGDWPEPQATRLTDAAHAFGECHLYVGDDGKVHAD